MTARATVRAQGLAAAAFAAAMGATATAHAQTTTRGTTLFLREHGASHAVAPDGALDPAARRAAPPANQSPTDARLALVRAAIDEARRAFLDSRFSDAAAGARAAFTRNAFALLPAGRAELAELSVWAGASHALSEATEAARDDFAQALSLAPDYSLPAGVFPVAVEALFAEVQRDHAAALPTAVTVRCVPSGARVEVDGAPAGRAPVTLTLAPGPHLLRVERVGYQPFQNVVRAQSAGLQTQEIVLLPAAGAALRAQLESPAGLPELPDAPTLAAIRAEYHATAVLVARRDGSLLRDPAAPRRPPPAGVPAWPFAVGGAALGAGAIVTVIVLVVRAQTYTLHGDTR